MNEPLTIQELVERNPLDVVRESPVEGAALIERILFNPVNAYVWDEFRTTIGASRDTMTSPRLRELRHEILEQGVVVLLLSGRLDAGDLGALLCASESLLDLAERAQVEGAYFREWREAFAADANRGFMHGHLLSSRSLAAQSGVSTFHVPPVEQGAKTADAEPPASSREEHDAPARDIELDDDRWVIELDGDAAEWKIRGLSPELSAVDREIALARLVIQAPRGASEFESVDVDALVVLSLSDGRARGRIEIARRDPHWCEDFPWLSDSDEFAYEIKPLDSSALEARLAADDAVKLLARSEQLKQTPSPVVTKVLRALPAWLASRRTADSRSHRRPRRGVA